MIGLERGRERQRPLRAEEPHELHEDLHRIAGFRGALGADDVAARKGEERVLADLDDLLVAPRRRADARLVGVAALELAQELEHIPAPGGVVQPVEARRPAHSIGPVPERGGQRITGPRLRAAITVSVKLLIWT